jgi:hypothetical protein
MLVLIVGLRVEVLKLSASVGSGVQQVASLQSSNAILAARISALSDNGRIERLAASYGMHLPNPLDVHFLEAATGAHLSAAIRNISKPSATAFLAGLAAEQQHDALLTQAGSTLSAIGAAPTTPTVTLNAAGTTAAGAGTANAQVTTTATASSTNSAGTVSNVASPPVTTTVSGGSAQAGATSSTGSGTASGGSSSPTASLNGGSGLGG